MSLSAGVAWQEDGVCSRWPRGESQSAELRRDSPGSPSGQGQKQKSALGLRNLRSVLYLFPSAEGLSDLLGQLLPLGVNYRALGCFALGRVLSKIASSCLGQQLGMVWASVSNWEPLIEQ